MELSGGLLSDVDCGDLAPPLDARPDSRPPFSGSETGVPRGRSGPPVDGGVGPPHSTLFSNALQISEFQLLAFQRFQQALRIEPTLANIIPASRFPLLDSFSPHHTADLMKIPFKFISSCCGFGE